MGPDKLKIGSSTWRKDFWPLWLDNEYSNHNLDKNHIWTIGLNM